jgi:hypothetical protein
VTLIIQGLSRSSAAAIELPESALGRIVVSDRFSAYNHFHLEQQHLCWALLIRYLIAIPEPPGASAEFGAELLGLQQYLFGPWHNYMEASIDCPAL